MNAPILRANLKSGLGSATFLRDDFFMIVNVAHNRTNRLINFRRRLWIKALQRQPCTVSIMNLSAVD